jgi:putative iron-only hydrogenase system regulator
LFTKRSSPKRITTDYCRLKPHGNFKEEKMENRVAIMAVIVENSDSVEALNALLHEYGEFIIGRMGIPYKTKDINIISIALDAPQDTISALSGKIGKIDGISVKTVYSNK